MSQFNAPVRRSDAELDVYTALLGVAALVLLAGVVLLAMNNSEHSGMDNQPGGMFHLVTKTGR